MRNRATSPVNGFPDRNGLHNSALDRENRVTRRAGFLLVEQALRFTAELPSTRMNRPVGVTPNCRPIGRNAEISTYCPQFVTARTHRARRHSAAGC